MSHRAANGYAEPRNGGAWRVFHAMAQLWNASLVAVDDRTVAEQHSQPETEVIPMTRTPLQTRVSLDYLHFYEEGDGTGSAEPYLWTVFFKIDGDTAKLDDDAFLHGTCTVVATPGSHGNLGDSDVDDGDDVIVPRAVGELLATLKPIPLGDKIAQQLKTEDAGAVVGVVMVLMEEDQVSDGGAEAGHARLNALVEEAINSLILPVGVAPDIPGGDAYKKLGVNKTEVTDEDIEALTAGAPDAIRAAIRAAQYGWDNVWSWLDGDDQVGVKVLTYRYEDLTDNYWDISERFQKVIATNNGPAIVEDWRVLGEAQGTRSDLQGYAHLRRSEEYGTPAASGAPTACLLPFLGVRNIVYRDADGHLHELWSDVRGLTGTTDVTDNAKAPTAAGNAYSYVDTTAGLEMVVYRSRDGHVHSLYWSTGDVGHDSLTASIGAPTASGDPVGFFTPATNVHHVIYRTSDGHLHALWWSGADAAQHVDINESIVPPVTPAPPAAGDPSAYLDSTRGVSIVVYRARDRSVHLVYWSDGPIGHDDVSGFTRYPARRRGTRRVLHPGGRPSSGDVPQRRRPPARGVVGRRGRRPGVGSHGGVRGSPRERRPCGVLQRRHQHQACHLPRPLRSSLRDPLGAGQHPDLRRSHAVGARPTGHHGPSRGGRRRLRHAARRLPRHRQRGARDPVARQPDRVAVVQHVPGPVLRGRCRHLALPRRWHARSAEPLQLRLWPAVQPLRRAGPPARLALVQQVPGPVLRGRCRRLALPCRWKPRYAR